MHQMAEASVIGVFFSWQQFGVQFTRKKGAGKSE
jgi:hypothetical protein